MKIRIHFQDEENGFWLNDFVINVEPEPYWSSSLWVLRFPALNMTITDEYLEAKKNGEI